ncbi:hypothetical protein KY362_07815 [Candidatus Woesearchaeota archaeon]|nr:hypothetical protein [Candidatus Woesearchaeota archaeon]
MTVHHVMQDSDQIRTCPYCSKDIDNTDCCESKHWEGRLYKELTCGKCGSKRLIRMEFDGSGDDTWFDEITMPKEESDTANLDEKVAKAEDPDKAA